MLYTFGSNSSVTAGNIKYERRNFPEIIFKYCTYVLSFENLEATGKFRKISDKFTSPVADYRLTVTFDSVDRSFNPSRYTEITRMSYSDYKAFKDDTKNAYEDIRDTWFKK